MEAGGLGPAYCLLCAAFLFGLFFELRMSMAYFSETSADFRRTTRYWSPEERTFHRFRLFLLSDKKKILGLNPLANYTDRATAACRRSDRQLLRMEGATWSA
jgi:hypothetical protein